MSNTKTHQHHAPKVEAGYTPTGATKHLLETWDRTSRGSRTVCNSVARTAEDMKNQFNLKPGDMHRLEALPWCSKCSRWAESMVGLHSTGVKTKAPVDIVEQAAALMGLTGSRGLAKVIVMAEWKKERRR